MKSVKYKKFSGDICEPAAAAERRRARSLNYLEQFLAEMSAQAEEEMCVCMLARRNKF